MLFMVTSRVPTPTGDLVPSMQHVLLIHTFSGKVSTNMNLLFTFKLNSFAIGCTERSPPTRDTAFNGCTNLHKSLRKFTDRCLRVCHAPTPTVLAQLYPDLLHRISITPINVEGCFYLCRWSYGHGEGHKFSM